MVTAFRDIKAGTEIEAGMKDRKQFDMYILPDFLPRQGQVTSQLSLVEPKIFPSNKFQGEAQGYSNHLHNK